MGKCDVCKGEMLEVDGCIRTDIICKSKSYEPIKVGSEEDFCVCDNEDERCGDCGAKVGHYHHLGCDCERCPVCGEQLISCDCDYNYDE